MRLATVPDLVATRDHFSLNPWQPGERRLTFHLTLQAAPDLYTAAIRVQDALEGVAHVRPVPRAWLHLTMSGLGRDDQVDRIDLADVADRVFDQWQRFARERITYDQLLVADESVMLTARNDAWLQELARVQRDAIDALLGPHEWRTLWPHTTLAYCDGAVPADELVTRLQPVADTLPDEIEAPPVLTLMSLARDGSEYTWQVVRDEGPA